MDDFKFATIFLVLGITISVIVPVQSYGFFQPQYFQLPVLQQPYSPYPQYDIYRVNHDPKSIPSPAYQPAYPINRRTQVPIVYNYYGTPVYDFRSANPFYPGGRPIFPPPPPPLGPYGPYDPFSPENPEKGEDDGIEKLEKHEADKKKNKKTQKPKDSGDATEPVEDTTEPIETTTEPSDESITVDALPE
ncbi:uncharacterized protein LOC117174571 [Belonocnema kinseyi]|uniref:uncharacterized protein LOC117174571 n=1 Tax=Belonocnema kinseyi TaxID=2817044 RepID=UPI00143DE5B2|nr:uncharacterized protein LOC117174571 [Belonocnema kinseyi]